MTADDELIRQPANVLLNIFQSIYQADQLVPLIMEILQAHKDKLHKDTTGSNFNQVQMPLNATISSLEVLMVLLKDTVTFG